VDSFGQGGAQSEHVRSTSVYTFVQDSWKVKPNLTLNYGLRWELDTPLTDISGHVQTFRPGQNSTVYPCDPAVTTDYPADCPTGLVVPGDKGVPAGMTQTYYKAFAPRFGVAWSPGKSGKTSIRGGWGMFYNPMEQLVMEQFSAEPPFGGSSFIFQSFFNTPYEGQDGSVTPNPFNGILNPVKGQDPGWANFRPLLLFGEFQPHMRTQYSEQYNLTIQREVAKDMLLQVGYVGSQGHRLLASRDLNPGNPQTCLDIISAYGGLRSICGRQRLWLRPDRSVSGCSGSKVSYAKRHRHYRGRGRDSVTFCGHSALFFSELQPVDRGWLPL
jgi:hypothetical protein